MFQEKENCQRESNFSTPIHEGITRSQLILILSIASPNWNWLVTLSLSIYFNCDISQARPPADSSRLIRFWRGTHPCDHCASVECVGGNRPRFSFPQNLNPFGVNVQTIYVGFTVLGSLFSRCHNPFLTEAAGRGKKRVRPISCVSDLSDGGVVRWMGQHNFLILSVLWFTSSLQSYLKD